MIEDPGPYGLALIGIVCMICLLVWLRNRQGLNEMCTGHLYMMYFFGAHTAYEIMNEIDPREYTVTAVYHDLKYLEHLGYVERDKYLHDGNHGRYGEVYMMTDAGEEAYKKYARRFGMDFYEDEKPPPYDGQQIERRPA